MSVDFEDRLRARLKDRWKCPEPVGLSLDELKEVDGLELEKLPARYIEFLRVCGEDAGTMFFDFNWSPISRKTRNHEMRLSASECDFSFETDLFTFLDFMGDFFWCFKLDAGDDPDVVRYDLIELVDIGCSLSQFLLEWEQFEEP